MASLNVYKDRTNIVPVNFGYDISSDTFESEIREGKDSSTTLIATWSIAFLTDGTDGKLIFTIDDSELLNVAQKKGYMDIKRITDGEPYPVMSDPITVIFKNQVTE